MACCDLISGGDDDSEDTREGGSTYGADQLANEFAEAKSVYSKSGAQFKFRLSHSMETQCITTICRRDYLTHFKLGTS